ncbi:MAG: hypothetical protein ABI840_11955 [bacterium]
MEKIVKYNGKTYYHASKYREEKNISYQQMNNLLHGKKYKKRYVKKVKEDDLTGMEKKVEYNYIAAPKFKKGMDYIVRGGFIYVSEDLFSQK